MLYLIGLGLSFKDLAVRSLDILKTCSEVYLENYTSTSDFSLKQLEGLLKKNVVVLDRKAVETDKPFLSKSKNKKVALLVYGDVLSATTHTEILLDAKQRGIQTQVLHAPSILTAIAGTGLSLYKFGKTASVPFWEAGFEPESFYDILSQNQRIGAHTLFLLDLRPEQKKFMTIKQAIDMLLKIARKRKSSLFTQNTHCIGCSNIGTSKQIIRAGTAKHLLTKRFGTPACLIVPAKLAEYELEALNEL
jgi:diphthine synthase